MLAGAELVHRLPRLGPVRRRHLQASRDRQPARASDKIMHITDWFTTILHAAGLSEPDDRV